MRIYTEGFEHGTIGWMQSGSVVTSNPTPRSGVYCFSTGTGTTARLLLPNAASELYIRQAVYWETGRSYRVFAYSGTTEQGRIELTTLGTVAIYVGSSTKVAESGVVHTATGWRLIEWYLKIANSGGVTAARVDGTTVASYTGDTQPSSATTISEYRFSPAGTYSMFVDDIAINDTTGTIQNGWPGDGKIYALVPTSDAQAQWSRNTGSSNAGCVSDRPPDGDTTYVYTSTSGAVDKYNLSGTLPSDLRGITGVFVTAYARSDAGESLQLQLGVDSNGTESWSGSMVVPTSYAMLYGPFLTTDPATGGSWTVSAVQNAKACLKAV